ncbi:hypothetical protein CRG98_008654, partial [Punica granatum]
MWYGKRPNMSFLKIWGCETYVKRLSSDKLGPKSDKCYFVGYPKETRGYYFYNPIEGKVFVARTAVFLEKEFLFKGTSGRKLEFGEVLPQNDIDQSTGEIAEQVPQSVVAQSSAQATQESHNDEPTTYGEAVIGPDSEKWLEAMRYEIESMYTNQVWTLVDPPEGAKPIGCKWIFKKKTDMDEFGFIKNEDEPCVYKK